MSTTISNQPQPGKNYTPYPSQSLPQSAPQSTSQSTSQATHSSQPTDHSTEEGGVCKEPETPKHTSPTNQNTYTPKPKSTTTPTLHKSKPAQSTANTSKTAYNRFKPSSTAPSSNGPTYILLKDADSLLELPKSKDVLQEMKLHQKMQKMGLKYPKFLLHHIPNLKEAIETPAQPKVPSPFDALDILGTKHQETQTRHVRALTSAHALNASVELLNSQGLRLSDEMTAKLAQLANRGMLDQLTHPNNPLSAEQKQALLMHMLQDSDAASKIQQVLSRHDFTTPEGIAKFKARGQSELTAVFQEQTPADPNSLELLKQCALDTPDKLFKDPVVVDMLKKMGVKDLDKYKDKIGKTKDGIEFIISLNKARVAYKQGNYRHAVGHAVRAFGSLQALFSPESSIGKNLNAVTKQAYMTLLRFTKNDSAIKSAEKFFNLAQKAGVMPNFTKLVGHLMLGDWRELFKEVGDIAKGIAWNPNISPGERAMAGKDLLMMVAGFLPKKLKETFLAKAAGRKVPLLSLALGVFDATQATIAGIKCKAGNKASCEDAKTHALNTLSSFSGSFPGAGTLVSVGADLVNLYRLFSQNSDVILKQFKDPWAMFKGFVGSPTPPTTPAPAK